MTKNDSMRVIVRNILTRICNSGWRKYLSTYTLLLWTSGQRLIAWIKFTRETPRILDVNSRLSQLIAKCSKATLKLTWETTFYKQLCIHPPAADITKIIHELMLNTLGITVSKTTQSPTELQIRVSILRTFTLILSFFVIFSSMLNFHLCLFFHL
jgi:hypothetical protein